MVLVNLIAVIISLAVMVRASNLFNASSMMPAPLPGALQFVGVFAIITLVGGLVGLSV